MNPVRANSKPILQSNGVNQNLTASFASANLNWIEFVFRPDSTTEAICDFGTGKEVEIIAGTVTVTGLGTVVIQVNGVTTATGVTTEFTKVRIDLDAPVAVTEVAVFDNNGTFGTLDLVYFKTDLFNWSLFEGAGTIALDTGKSINGTTNATWLLSQSGCNDTLAANPTETGVEQLIDQEGNIHTYFDGVDDNVLLSAVISQILTTTNAWRLEFKNIFIGEGSNMGLFGFSKDSNNRFVIYVNTTTPILYCDFFVSGVYISANTSAIAPNTVINSLVVAYSGSRTAAGITFNIDGDTGRASTGGSGTISNTTLTWTALPRIASRGGGSNPFKGVIPELNIYDAVSGGNLIHSFKDFNDFNDSESAITATINGSPSKLSVIEDPASIGNDLLGQSIDKSIKIGGTQKKWNIFLETWYESLDTLSADEFVVMFILDGNALSTLTNAILLDARAADNDGILLHINGSGYPEIQYNTQDVAASSVLSNALQLITFWATDTDLKIRIDGTEVATATKTGGTISATNFITLFAEAFGTKANFFQGQLCEAYYIPQNVELATVQSIENAYITEYSI